METKSKLAESTHVSSASMHNWSSIGVLARCKLFLNKVSYYMDKTCTVHCIEKGQKKTRSYQHKKRHL